MTQAHSKIKRRRHNDFTRIFFLKKRVTSTVTGLMFIGVNILQAFLFRGLKADQEAFFHFLQQRHLPKLHKLVATQPVVQCVLRRVEIRGILHEVGCLWTNDPKHGDRNLNEMQLRLQPPRTWRSFAFLFWRPRSSPRAHSAQDWAPMRDGDFNGGSIGWLSISP